MNGRHEARIPVGAARRESGRAVRTGLMTLAAAVVVSAGCDGLLDVENPNELVQEDLESPAAAAAVANGALATVGRAFGDMVLLHGSASDELTFVGSRDAWVQLQQGDLRDPANEFTDAAWPFIAEGRWMADEAIRLLKSFDSDGHLNNRTLLARSQLYSAIMYTQIADLWEDFVLSDRKEAQPPVGAANMQSLYDRAIQGLDEALPIAQAAGNQELETAILAQRARSKHARAVGAMLRPAGSIPANPLVNDASAVADAQAALARATGPTWAFRFAYSAATVTNNWGAWVNERLELRVSDDYAVGTEDGKRVASIRLMDPIDQIPDPALAAIVNEATTARQFGPVTVVSAREMRLILAEAALAAGDMGGFTTHINAVRELNNLTPYSGQVDALELLKHSRRVHLFNTGRRLNDHYRFGDRATLWNPNFEAANRPGTLFPITETERRSNCHVGGGC